MQNVWIIARDNSGQLGAPILVCASRRAALKWLWCTKWQHRYPQIPIYHHRRVEYECAWQFTWAGMWLGQPYPVTLWLIKVAVLAN